MSEEKKLDREMVCGTIRIEAFASRDLETPMVYVRSSSEPGSDGYEVYSVTQMQRQIARTLTAPDTPKNRAILTDLERANYTELCKRGFQVIHEEVQETPIIDHPEHGSIAANDPQIIPPTRHALALVTWSPEEHDQYVAMIAKDLVEYGSPRKSDRATKAPAARLTPSMN